jgi:adenosylcobinamide-GDP ribazoletransferase
MKRWLVDRAGELAASAALLTRLPVGGLVPAGVDFARSVWGYPVVGVGIGFAGGLVNWATMRCGLSPALAAAWTLAALVLLTGGFHEDGLADTADGFGGGRTPARKLEIMRDSRIGSYGALALILTLAVRGVALAGMAGPERATLALVVSGCLGRAAIVIVLAATKPARPDGMASALAAMPTGAVLAACAVGIGITLFLPIHDAMLAVVLAAIVAAGMAALAVRQVGGHTGDVLGATSVLTECVVLSALSG